MLGELSKRRWRGILCVCGVVVFLAVLTGHALGDSRQAATTTSQPAHVDKAGASSGNFFDDVYSAFHSVRNWLVIGLALILGRIGGRFSRRFRTPMVVGYLIIGVILGKSVLNIMSTDVTNSLELVTDFGLSIVAFMIGTELSGKLIKRLGAKLIIIMVSESLMAFIVVSLLVLAFGQWAFPVAGLTLAGALVFGAMAPASAPAGTVAVIQEFKTKGPMTSLLLGVVGLDDAFAIMIFAFAAAAAKMLLSSTSLTLMSLVEGPCLEIVGGLAVGAVVGVLLMMLLRRRKDHDDTMVYALGAVLLTTGIANALGLSLILANLTVGAVLANMSVRDTEHAYERLLTITAPVYVLFFVVAGAHLDLRLLGALSLLGPLYIIGRVTGKIGGAYLGARISGADKLTRRYLGLGILSQAGVAIGLALTVANEFSAPQYGALGKELASLTINTIAATTIIFEIIGPITTKIALTKAGEIGKAVKARGESA